MKIGTLNIGVDMRVVVAFGAIYVLWGTTFLAIRIAVLEFPPLFTAGLRFFIAGTLLYAYMRLRGQPNPSPIEWRNLALVSICMFVIDNRAQQLAVLPCLAIFAGGIAWSVGAVLSGQLTRRSDAPQI